MSGIAAVAAACAVLFCASGGTVLALRSVSFVEVAALAAQESVFITDIELARDDGAGRHGRVVSGFRTKDNPLHCVVTLSRAQAGTRVRFVWTAVDAGGMRDNVLANAESVTKPREIVVDGVLSLPREWPAGRYRVQAAVNNRPPKTIEFTIE